MRARARSEAAADEVVASLLGIRDRGVLQCSLTCRDQLLRELATSRGVERLVGLRLVGDVLRLHAFDGVAVQIGRRAGR